MRLLSISLLTGAALFVLLRRAQDCGNTSVTFDRSFIRSNFRRRAGVTIRYWNVGGGTKEVQDDSPPAIDPPRAVPSGPITHFWPGLLGGSPASSPTSREENSQAIAAPPTLASQAIAAPPTLASQAIAAPPHCQQQQ
jgi:hypothetical protein